MSREALELIALTLGPWFSEGRTPVVVTEEVLAALKDEGGLVVLPSDRPALEAKVAEALHEDQCGCGNPWDKHLQGVSAAYIKDARIALDAIFGGDE